MKLIDISPVVSPDSPVWPGDSPFELALHSSFEDGGGSTVGTVRTTTHIGSHIDAPAHLEPGAASVVDTPIDACIGSCVVLDVTALFDRGAQPHGQLSLERLQTALALITKKPVERLLMRHYSTRPTVWDENLPGVAVSVMRWFAAQGGRLMGVDLMSFDPVQDQQLECHREAVASGVVLLEGLDLTAAVEGRAELIALPLPWAGADASPVRAVLRYATKPGALNSADA